MYIANQQSAREKTPEIKMARLRITKIDEYQYLTFLKNSLWGSRSACFKDWQEGDYLAFIVGKERLHLDKMMPCRDGWVPKEFELDPQKVLAYRNIYKYYPAYTEMLL